MSLRETLGFSKYPKPSPLQQKSELEKTANEPKQVQCACGHFVPLIGRTPEKIERKKRRFASQACGDCKNLVARAKELELKRERDLVRFTGKASGFIRDRLPDGSTFSLKYSAEDQSWTGFLTVPECPQFVFSGSHLQGTIHLLDTKYRAWKFQNQPEENERNTIS